MRIVKMAHVADAHWGLNYPGPNPSSRFEDISRTMDWVADKIIAERCQYVLFSGDAFKDSNVMINRASVEIKAFVTWIRKLTAHGIKVVIISGTPSHDSVAAYEIIKEMDLKNTYIYTHPGIIDFSDFEVVCFPGLNRSSILTQEEYRGLQPHEVHQEMTSKIAIALKGLRAQCSCSETPVVLMSHMTYAQADTGFSDLLMQHEPVLTDESVSEFDLVALGHIHRPQQVRNVFYSGSPERLSFNDESVKAGFYVHQLEDKKVQSRFIETPARKFVTLDLTEKEISDFVEYDAMADWVQDTAEKVADSVVRVRYSCSEDLNKRFNKKAMERVLVSVGAHFIHAIEGEIQRTDRQRSEEVTESLTPVMAMAVWAQQQSISPEEISELSGMTETLLAGGMEV
ncbi:metallophosphoesterase family protein [Acetonema longum]|uniref:Nuclease SbcCD subunit D n=1 Tax=Acetonema longum DSM 6540 TaxID=1009370 RepID=F7NKF0_9FIRM|nr:exonuclease subunit SbcD [Acetonema longum]EGO63591.1 hypothetical protein ALO_12816 [Acetonema longum DSM 6540]